MLMAVSWLVLVTQAKASLLLIERVLSQKALVSAIVIGTLSNVWPSPVYRAFNSGGKGSLTGRNRMVL